MTQLQDTSAVDAGDSARGCSAGAASSSSATGLPQELDAELAQQLDKLTKKHSTTRLKALQVSWPLPSAATAAGAARGWQLQQLQAAHARCALLCRAGTADTARRQGPRRGAGRAGAVDLPVQPPGSGQQQVRRETCEWGLPCSHGGTRFLARPLLLPGCRAVRAEAAHVTGAIAAALGRRLAPSLKSLFPVWWLARYDCYSDVTAATAAGLDAAFPGGKQTDALAFCREEVRCAALSAQYSTVQHSTARGARPAVMKHDLAQGL